MTTSNPDDKARANLRRLLELVAEMRAEQKAFFVAAGGSPERRRALRASKALEQEVDALIVAIRNGTEQTSLW